MKDFEKLTMYDKNIKTTASDSTDPDTVLPRFETPDKWLILEVPDNYHKVFGTWMYGSWKLNSGIEKVEQDENFYYFIGFSGSCYKCHKKGYGFASSYGLNVLNELIERSKGQVKLLEDYESKIIT